MSIFACGVSAFCNCAASANGNCSLMSQGQPKTSSYKPSTTHRMSMASYFNAPGCAVVKGSVSAHNRSRLEGAFVCIAALRSLGHTPRRHAALPASRAISISTPTESEIDLPARYCGHRAFPEQNGSTRPDLHHVLHTCCHCSTKSVDTHAFSLEHAYLSSY